MARVGIYGATGYTGFELIKLLVRHPDVEIAFATARSAAGQRLCDIFPTFIDQPLVSGDQVDLSGVDLIFTCLPHNTPDLIPIVRSALDAGVRVVDFSDTFRISDPARYAYWRKKEHPAPDLQLEAVYGLPERYREQIRNARLVANTGCYPLTVIFPLYPLVQAGLLADATVIADSKSGVSGAGRSLALKTHFGETHETFSAYNVGRTHRHIAEMEQETGLHLIFAPHLLPVYRGILSTIYVTLKPGVSHADVRAAYAIYANEPFIHLMPEGRLPELRHVAGTMDVAIGVQPVEPERGSYILVACVDNLVKGASGQAVQNMNLMLGFEETSGLR
ncbi:N-acetyl-gamma-glutamyl-phosphate reductase [Oscillochloris trichoides DG-6]|uniref:N-acetyl-gamma-glutamyl-phosphate reductase n=1 Tax=Oscillochloris trichoides DG-6 TaxID=765420 RepID=E1IDY4_9CHLR|nr:N-acetyl-gamma-glutamyl-phosphate reductase [Oscillochloris trichoides]EFO80595.1 N-acetyl-gamma-glutamyl-phosphate reductase [Oscillochloris trichoides DG-6]